MLFITSQSFSMHRRAFAGKRHLHSKCRCPTQHNPTNTKQSFMTCPILKRPADCTRPGPSRLSFTPKPRPKQCVGELEIPGLPSTARTLFSGLRVSTHGKQAGPLVGFYHSAGRQPANSTPRPAGGDRKKMQSSRLRLRLRNVHTVHGGTVSKVDVHWIGHH